MSPQPNPLTQLPNVDFNFDELRQRMSAFTLKFDAFIERGRKRVLEERNEFRERLGELAGMSWEGVFFPYLSFRVVWWCCDSRSWFAVVVVVVVLPRGGWLVCMSQG
jgi:hypothetical protein